MATQSKKILLTPDALLAFIDRAQEKHDQASAFFRFFAQGQYQLFTDILTLQIVYDHLYKNISPSLAKDFMRTIALSDLNIVYPDENDFRATTKTFLMYQANDMTFHLSMLATLANRRNISLVCTFSYFPNLF